MIPFHLDGKTFAYDSSLIEASAFTVRSVPRHYTVTWCQDDPVEQINLLLKDNPHNLLLIDEVVYQLMQGRLQVAEQRLFRAAVSEEFKTMESLQKLLDFLDRNRVTKTETLIVVGGGVVQDVGSFAAACYRRGTRWVFFPTTLLAMCDSCIGGKASLNYGSVKNQLGLFSTPSAIMIYPAFLETLPPGDCRSGMGEILKLAITGGGPFWERYKRSVKEGASCSLADTHALIFSALAVKKAVIEEDEFELHHRRSLNYGHTLGHALEILSEYRIPHGSAVVVGMILANQLSQNRTLLDQETNALLCSYCLDLLDPAIGRQLAKIETEALLDLLRKDKKTEGGEALFILPQKVGELRFKKVQINQSLQEEVREALQQLVTAYHA